MRLKVTMLLILMLVVFTTGCATPRIQIVDPIGRQIPKPSFVLQSADKPITALFYYTSFEKVKDIDGTVIAQPNYLNFLDKQIFHKNTRALTLTIEVSNPNQTLYSFECEETLNNSSYRLITLNASNMPYRQFIYSLPFNENLKSVEHCVFMRDQNGDEILRIGPFKYSIER